MARAGLRLELTPTFCSGLFERRSVAAVRFENVLRERLLSSHPHDTKLEKRIADLEEIFRGKPSGCCRYFWLRLLVMVKFADVHPQSFLAE